MSNEPVLDTMSLEERARLKKQLSDQAVKLAVNSRWQEAANVNREYLNRFGDEAEALNRLGKALTELGQITEARECYGKSLEADPSNTIARRNLDRLATMTDSAGSAPSQLDTRLFVEETGTATVAKLQATDAKATADLDAGDIVGLQVQGNAVNVLTVSGEYVGMVEPRIGLRLSKMMEAGNRYAAAMVTTTGEPKVILRETFKHPSMIDKVSFPQGRTSDVRAYTRKGLLRRDDDDYGDYSEDDEIVEEDTDEGWSETDGELDSGTPDISVDQDDESFD
ncbi:MAG: tetratricopeptide repeat protein [Dehalococcoidia bacterium]